MRSLLLLCLSGCAGFHIAGFGAPPAQHLTALNPLGGRALVAAVTPADSELQVASASRCSLWPLNDQYSVEADWEELCVTATKNLLSYESGPLPIDALQLQVSVDGRPPVPVTALAAGAPRKVGRCWVNDSQRTAVWQLEFTGCRRNDVVVPQTRELTLLRQGGWGAQTEVAQWAFVDARPAVEVTPVAVAPAPAPVNAAVDDYRRGLQLLGASRYDEAVVKFSSSVARDPRLVEGYLGRGNALMGQRRYTEAVADYRYATVLRPDLAAPCFALGEAYARMGLHREARLYYQQYVEMPGADAQLKALAQAKLRELR